MKRAKVAQRIWQVLVGAAHRRQVITYQQLADMVDVGPAGTGAGVMGQFLGPVMKYCDAEGLPALTTIVVKHSTGAPGDGLTTSKDFEVDRELAFDYAWFKRNPPTVEELARFEK